MGKMSNNDYIKGTCMDMCPEEEVKMREKQKLLHILEMVPGTERSKFPKANRSCMVKSFSRSAAGKAIKAADLRPPKVLLNTISYLLFDVINNNALPWHATYDFITDRLLAVRQDMVVQNVSHAETITILQPIVRFYAFAAYKLCDEDLSNFDPVLNNNHLQVSLNRLLCSYDAYDNLLSKNANMMPNSSYDYLIENRPEFEALNVIFNIGNEDAMRRALNIPGKCKTQVVKDAIELCLCYKYGNFVRLCRLMRKLPTLLAAMASLFLPDIRRKAFEVMSTAYNSKNLKFPTTVLKDILLYGSTSDILQDCRYYGIRIDEESIYFSRQSFDVLQPVVNTKHEAFVEMKLAKTDLQSILFGEENNT